MVGGIPMEMTPSMIAEVVEAFASATRRCRDGGLDGVDVHASSGYLIEQFLSPANNTREDEYGGSLENRMRFLMEILQAIRAEVGDDYCVGIRLPNEEYIPGGLTNVEVAEKNGQSSRLLVRPQKGEFIADAVGAAVRANNIVASEMFSVVGTLDDVFRSATIGKSKEPQLNAGNTSHRSA